MTDKNYLSNLRTPTEQDPLRILTSACLLGSLCGVDGTSNGTYPNILNLNDYNNVKMISFCPEDFAFGTPRETPDIKGGTGADVLDGKAMVITESGIDITNGMIKAAEEMLKVALEHHVELAMLMDISGACGSQVIYKGHRFSENPEYQIGMGVCAALLDRNGIKIISQRDFKSLEILFSKIDAEHKIDSSTLDHHETDWYLKYFNK
jgi:uncharacterized protein YbbK (DUF523 family)